MFLFSFLENLPCRQFFLLTDESVLEGSVAGALTLELLIALNQVMDRGAHNVLHHLHRSGAGLNGNICNVRIDTLGTRGKVACVRGRSDGVMEILKPITLK